MKKWDGIKREDVIAAIQKYDEELFGLANAKTTFLVYNGIIYPGKQIRKIAYEIAYGNEPAHFYGGKETIDFFQNLEFDTYWLNKDDPNLEYDIKIEEMKKGKERKNIKQKDTKIEKMYNDNISNKFKNSKRIKVPTSAVREQKNMMQVLLCKLFSIVETEKTFEWSKVPRTEDDYKKIIDGIATVCGTKKFAEKKFSIAFDFVCEKQKLIIEYDEKQHFTEARKIALMLYPENIRLHYDKELWIKACADVDAKMKNKPLRDETRAYYDSVRDIEAARNGYKLIRIMHGQIDFSESDATEKLLLLLNKN